MRGYRRRIWLLGVALFGLLLAGCAGGGSTAPGTTQKVTTQPGTTQKGGPQPVSVPEGGTKRIIILINGNSPFWDACRVGLNEANKDLKLDSQGLKAILEVNDGTPQGQLDKLRQFASQTDVAAIGVSAIDARNAAIADQMRELQKSGVKVITIDSDLDRQLFRDRRFAFVGTDNLAGGKVLGQCARLLRPEGGKYVTFVGRTGAQNAIERVGGFKEGAGDKFQSLDNMGDQNDRTKARQNVRDAIANHPDLNVLVGIWSYNAPAIVDVVREGEERRKKFTIVTFDAEPGAIEEQGKGMIDAMVVQNPYQMGYQGVRLMKALIQDDQKTIKEMLPHHGEKDGDVYDTGLKVVVPDDSKLTADQFDKKTTEFLKLGDFRKWLDKYKLTGS
jgi:ribose transport system substrate-binding protein